MGLATPAVKSAREAADERPTGRSRVPYLVIAGYLIGAVYVTGRLWPDPASRAQGGDLHDVDQMTWFMRYSEQAVARFQLPALVTHALNAPHTVNLMWNTSLLLPGVIMAPVTFIGGPQVSLNVLLALGFFLSASTMYLVLRRWGARIASAALGGALYGFSPAMIGSGIGHYHLVLAMLPPLMIDAMLRIVTGRGRAWRNGLWLGLLASGQLFIGEEALIDTAIAGAVLLIMLAACRPRAVLGQARGSLAGFATAAGLALVLCGHALWVQFHGTHAGGAYNVVSHDGHMTHLYTIPYAFVVPSNMLVVHNNWSASVAASYPQPAPEYLAYLGIPLIVVLLAAGIYFWRRLPVRVAFLTFLGLELLSLGGQPIGPYPGFLLPWYWLQNLPMLSSTLPDRLSILADGAAAAVLAFALDEVRARRAARGSRPWRQPAVLGFAVAALALLPLVPLPYLPSRVAMVPGGYVGAIVEMHLPADAPVLVVPVPNGGLTRPMRWQADKGIPLEIIGGDFIDASVRGRTSRSGRAGETLLGDYMDDLWANNAPGPVPTQAQIRAQMAAWKPAGLVADALPTTPLGQFLIKEFGPPTVMYARFMAWRLGPSGM
ncbi:MAG TPA: hypothetical protein VEL03_14345 [Streptosporangiaceae bacterium]|nr:hypothetical protein [Streptosporangiaceae bacterium]